MGWSKINIYSGGFLSIIFTLTSQHNKLIPISYRRSNSHLPWHSSSSFRDSLYPRERKIIHCEGRKEWKRFLVLYKGTKKTQCRLNINPTWVLVSSWHGLKGTFPIAPLTNFFFYFTIIPHIFVSHLQL